MNEPEGLVTCKECGHTYHENGPEHECWAVFDYWRCIWEALALREGRAPGTGLVAHRGAFGEPPDKKEAPG
jgi:hypothetical protein